MKLNYQNLCTNHNDIQEDSIVIIRDDSGLNKLFRVRKVKISEDGVEIILSSRNKFFNFEMYKNGKSWVRGVWVIEGEVLMNATTNNTRMA